MLIRILILLFISTISCASMDMDYKVIDWVQANNMKQKEDTRFVMNLDYNLSTVYQLADSSYLVMPVSPFSKCLITKNKTTLDNWIAASYYPTEEEINSFYFGNKDKIDYLPQHKEQLKEELYKYIYKGADATTGNITSQEIDRIHKLLKQRKRFDEFKLHFMVLVGDYLIEKYSDENYHWGLLADKQLLNPITTLILVKNDSDIMRYFKLEDMIVGKWGYAGMQSIEHSIKQSWYRSNEIVTINKVM